MFRRALLAIVVALGLTHVAAAQEYRPSHYLVLVSPPDGPSVILSCDEDAQGIAGVPDPDAVNAAGQWFIGLDLGAHQAAYKLVCDPPR